MIKDLSVHMSKIWFIASFVCIWWFWVDSQVQSLALSDDLFKNNEVEELILSNAPVVLRKLVDLDTYIDSDHAGLAYI